MLACELLSKIVVPWRFRCTLTKRRSAIACHLEDKALFRGALDHRPTMAFYRSCKNSASSEMVAHPRSV
jgi:hypothetical protein